jgi:ferredoxin
MTVRVNHKLIDELEHYGAQDVVKCYHCGNCSAACPFSKEPFIFPRRPMRHLQMGLEARLKASLEPWLCYYCGECSEQCPREAEPGETMMSMRRWLTAKYDFSGISKLFYRSWKAELLAILLVAILTGIGLLWYGFNFGGKSLSVYHGAAAFLPSSAIHIFDWSMAGVLTALLAINCIRMWWFTMMGERSPKFRLWPYIKNVFLLPVHFITQMRYAKCERKRPWFLHLILMLSYVTMFSLIMFFLHEMQQGPEINWYVHGFGYFATAGLLIGVIFAIQGRIRKSEPYHAHSHETDWIFLVLLLVITVTGIGQHLLHRMGMNEAANITYIVHLMGVVPMLVLEVPFSKWAHLAYRPLAMYFATVQTDSMKVPKRRPGTVPGSQLVFSERGR